MTESSQNRPKEVVSRAWMKMLMLWWEEVNSSVQQVDVVPELRPTIAEEGRRKIHRSIEQKRSNRKHFRQKSRRAVL